jgi:hypothetical protein
MRRRRALEKKKSYCCLQTVRRDATRESQNLIGFSGGALISDKSNSPSNSSSTGPTTALS